MSMKNLRNIHMFYILVFIVTFVSSCSFVETPKKYAMVYGISRYIDSLDEGEGINLTYTDDDAVSIANLLENKGYIVILRTNSDATRAQFETDINTLNSEIKGNDLVLFYYSGHGAQSSDIQPPSKGLEPPERDQDDEWIFLYGSIYIDGANNLILDTDKTFTDDTLAKEMEKLNTDRKIIILDSCNSGGFIGNYLEVDNDPQTITNKPLPTETVIAEAIKLYFDYGANKKESADIPPNDAIVISASGESEYSYESNSVQHGIFTYFFLQAAEEADLNKDRYITTMEAYAYTSAAINLTTYPFAPHISGGPVDFILFPAN